MDTDCHCLPCESLKVQRQILDRLGAIESLLGSFPPELRSKEEKRPTNKTPKKRLLTIKEAAAELALSEPGLRLWVARRKIAVVHLGRSLRIPAVELERFIEENLVPTIPKKVWR